MATIYKVVFCRRHRYSIDSTTKEIRFYDMPDWEGIFAAHTDADIVSSDSQYFRDYHYDAWRNCGEVKIIIPMTLNEYGEFVQDVENIEIFS